MFKKLIERAYNKKVIKSLQNVEFDSFAFCGYNEFPMFFQRETAYTKRFLFVPITDETFKLAFSKLKNDFFKNCDFDEIKNRIKVYKAYVNISEEVCNECVQIAENKSYINVNNNKNNSNI